ncbi:MAG: hypothetical protein CMF50_02205 [Legionellales bacterium]|nr:hypothetical protein [Legionellales bacterium]|tara:strand:- start:37460 stop:37711 length:252 start_codon:yes stop_codon:yes gene_type:complete
MLTQKFELQTAISKSGQEDPLTSIHFGCQGVGYKAKLTGTRKAIKAPYSEWWSSQSTTESSSDAHGQDKAENPDDSKPATCLR